MGKESINKEWTEILDKKEIQKIKQNDLREILYVKIALLCVIPAYILRIIQSVFIVVYTSTAYKIGYILFMLLHTAILAIMLMLYRWFLNDDLVEKYRGTIWKTSGIVIDKGKKETEECYYEVKCRKFGEKGGYSYSCKIDRHDIEIGDTIIVVGCEREDDFYILTIYKDESYFENKGWMLGGMNIIVILGIIIFCPWYTRFGISAIYYLIWKSMVCIIAFITNLLAGVYEKDRRSIGISVIVIAGFLFFGGPQKLYYACLDLYEGAVVIENAEVSYEYEQTAAHRGDPFLYYAVLSKGTELDNKKIELPEAVFGYCTKAFRRPHHIIYYKNTGILVRFEK